MCIWSPLIQINGGERVNYMPLAPFLQTCSLPSRAALNAEWIPGYSKYYFHYTYTPNVVQQRFLVMPHLWNILVESSFLLTWAIFCNFRASPSQNKSAFALLFSVGRQIITLHDKCRVRWPVICCILSPDERREEMWIQFEQIKFKYDLNISDPKEWNSNGTIVEDWQPTN